MPVDSRTAAAGARDSRALGRTGTPTMGKVDQPKLTEEQILVLLADRRRTARLQSLQRISALSRTATATDNPAEPLARLQPTVSTANLDHLAPISASLDTMENGTHASGSDSLPPIAPEGWLARSQASVQQQHLAPLSRDGGSRTMESWTEALQRQPWGLWRDRALLLVEVVALVALVIVVSGSFSSMGALNEELSDARRAPVPVEAAAFAAEEELPGSSFPPSPSSAAPGPVRSPVQPGMLVSIPTPSAQAASRIVIPSIDVDSVIVEGDNWEDLKKGVGHHLNTANAGEKGNAVYSGHVDVYGEVFRRLEELKPGDLVTVYAGIHLYRYEVKRIRIVSPKETSVLAATTDATLTLITCYPYRVDTQRLVVIAKLVE
jgi:sortase A